MSNKGSKRAATIARQRRRSAQKHDPKNSSRGSSRQQYQHRQRRQNRQRRNPFWLIGGLLVGVAVVVGLFLYIGGHQPAAGVIGPTDPDVLNKVTHVKQKVFADVNTGGVENVLLQTGNSQELTGQNGKPEIFYYSAEFCPYCAAQRWSLVVALSRFGTFSKLPQTLSSGQFGEAAPNTSTFTFVKSQYTSSYIDFVAVEARDRDHNHLQTPLPHEQQVLKRYGVDGFPFVDIADQYAASNPFFDPSLLQGLSQKDIANKLSDANDNVTKKIVGGANYLTAAICLVTHDQPANACTQKPIPAIEQSIVQHTPNLERSQTEVVNHDPIALLIRRHEDNS